MRQLRARRRPVGLRRLRPRRPRLRRRLVGLRLRLRRLRRLGPLLCLCGLFLGLRLVGLFLGLRLRRLGGLYRAASVLP